LDTERVNTTYNFTGHPGNWRVENHQQTIFRPIWLCYHTDWAWLMPVIDKIEGLGYAVWFQSVQGGTQVTIWFGTTELFKPIYKNKIEAVYDAVTNFIQWYNDAKLRELKE